MKKKYAVAVRTSARKDAGTDANVFIQLLGRKATSPAMKLASGRSVFERSHQDVFSLEVEDVGAVDAVRMYHDNTNSNAGWFLDFVEVIDGATGERWRADFKRWLASDEDDGRIDVTRVTGTTRWMQLLHDHFQDGSTNAFGDVPLHQLPLPGTHDSGTYGYFHGGLKDTYARAQNLSIQEQLEVGCRYFDLRPLVDNDKFYVHHTYRSDVLIAEWPGRLPSQTEMDDLGNKSLLAVIRRFLKDNPREIIILKFQNFDAVTSQRFNPDDHRHFRELMNAYLPLISPRPVESLTLNNLYRQNEKGRVLVFYGDTLDSSDATTLNFWAYKPGGQLHGFIDLPKLVDPYWKEALGESGADDDDSSFKNRWFPYHEKNFREWQARGVARFLVMQAQMQELPGNSKDKGENSAKRNNPKNIQKFAEWMRAGVPGAQGMLRPNILSLDFIEYGSLCEEIIQYFRSLDVSRFRSEYPYARFEDRFVIPPITASS